MIEIVKIISMNNKEISSVQLGKNIIQLCKILLSYAIIALIFWCLLPMLAVLIGQYLDKILNFPKFYYPPFSYILAYIIILQGIGWMVWSWLSLFTIGKGHPNEVFGVALAPPTKKLVIRGAFRYTRNPMAFGFLSVIFGLGILYGSISSTFIVLAVYTLIAVTYLRLIEEKNLIKRFGDDYIQYKKELPNMMIPHINLNGKTDN